MNFPINRTFVFAALAGLAGACASQASTRATFHLPVTAHWGKTVLAPGDYKIEMNDHVTGLKEVIVTGGQQVVRAVPVTIDVTDQTRAASLRLVERDGNYFVQEYRSDMGKTYIFGVPKR